MFICPSHVLWQSQLRLRQESCISNKSKSGMRHEYTCFLQRRTKTRVVNDHMLYPNAKHVYATRVAVRNPTRISVVEGENAFPISHLSHIRRAKFSILVRSTLLSLTYYLQHGAGASEVLQQRNFSTASA